MDWLGLQVAARVPVWEHRNHHGDATFVFRTLFEAEMQLSFDRFQNTGYWSQRPSIRTSAVTGAVIHILHREPELRT